MATVHSHHFSVIANSSVKPPINPDTGLSLTHNERDAYEMRNTWNGYDGNDIGNSQDFGGVSMNGYEHEHRHSDGQRHFMTSGMFGKTDNMIQNISAELSDLPDDAFYSKLMELKREHEKTLNICETLYSEKHGHGPGHKGSSLRNSTGHIHGRNDHLRNSLEYDVNPVRSHSSQDHIKDMSPYKPPIGPRSRPHSAKPNTSRSHDFGHVQTDRSSDDEYWKPISAVTTDHEMSLDDRDDHSFHRHHRYLSHDSDHHHLVDNDSRHSAFSHIEDMWENFSVEEYAPPKNRQRSSSLSRLSRPTSSASRSRSGSRNDFDDGVGTGDWRHRVTVPKPFKMEQRENRKIKEKSRTLTEYEMKKAEERKREEEECQKKFKAKPVPAHVYMPLYDEITEEQEGKRKYNRENSKEVLKSLEKPFNFMKREEEKKRYRHKKCPTNDKYVARAEIEQRPPTGFKAKPFPVHIFDNSVSDQLHEEEEYRRIRIQMRAEELMKTSSLPPNMEARGKEYTDGKSRQKIYAERAKKAGITAEHKFHPNVNDTVPDFEHMHRKLHTEISQKKRGKEATVCKPFNLRTERIAKSKKHKVYEDIANDARDMGTSTWSFSNPRRSATLKSMRSLSSSMDSIPTKMTASAQLRASANKTRLQQELDAELAELERERQRRLKEKKLKKYISERAAINDNTQDLQATLKDKLKEYKTSERARQEEYRRTLHEIEERIEKRPLLFERALQANAKKAAEKKYMETLKRAGFDEDYIKTKGKEATDTDLTVVSDDEDYTFTQRSSARSRSRSRSNSRTRSRSRSGSRYRSDTDYTLSDLSQ